jgi:hypothetical protein
LIESGQIQIFESSINEENKLVKTLGVDETFGYIGFFTGKEIYTAKSS